MRVSDMVANTGHISRVSDLSSINHDFMSSVRREVHIIAFVAVSDLTNSEKSKKNSNFLLDMMVIVDIFLSKKLVSASKMVKNILYDLRFLRLKLSYSMISSVVESNSIPMK